jgi:stearoyl-CoA desaturase (delta-9 desaturase)
VATKVEIQPCEHETRDRIITGFVVGLPFVLAIVFGIRAWGESLNFLNLGMFIVGYVLTCLGVTMGFHRLFTHRSFKCGRTLKITLAILGSMAVEGPLISWVSDHRRHHAHSDKPGDPHSPHVDHDEGFVGSVKGLWHAHMGWLFMHDQRGAHERYAPDLLADPDLVFISRTFLLWAVLGLLIPFGLGFAVAGSLGAGLSCLLWAGVVRVGALNQSTFAVNSLGHTFGRQSYETRDHSTNFLPVALLALGEGWHNNHHAFPTSARHGLDRGQLDVTASVISACARLGLVWDVVTISEERKATKRLAPAPAPSASRALP